MDSTRKLTRIAEKVAPSRPPSYIAAHVLKALEVIGSALGVGRQQLARELGLGEGTARTLVKRLRDEGLVEASRGGMSPTKNGVDLLKSIHERIRSAEIGETGITVGNSNYAVLVKGAAERVRSGVEQRDSALKAGAKGATTLTFRDGRLHMPGMGVEIPPKLKSVLISRLKPGEGDIVIIGTADSLIMAELGAKAAALELLQ